MADGCCHHQKASIFYAKSLEPSKRGLRSWLHSRSYAQTAMNPTRLYHARYSASAAQGFSHFFEKPFVHRVRRRICIRIVGSWALHYRRANSFVIGIADDWDSLPCS